MVNIKDGKRTYFLSGMFYIALAMIICILSLSILKTVFKLSDNIVTLGFNISAIATIIAVLLWLLFTKTKWFEIWYLKETIKSEHNRAMMMKVLSLKLAENKDTWVKNMIQKLRTDIRFEVDITKANLISAFERYRTTVENIKSKLPEVIDQVDDLQKYSKEMELIETNFDVMQEELLDELILLEKEKSNPEMKETRLQRLAEYFFEEEKANKEYFYNAIRKEALNNVKYTEEYFSKKFC